MEESDEYFLFLMNIIIIIIHAFQFSTRRKVATSENITDIVGQMKKMSLMPIFISVLLVSSFLTKSEFPTVGAE